MIHKEILCLFTGIVWVIFSIYAVQNLVHPKLFSMVNPNEIAIKVRNKDEKRLAESLSKIGEWRLHNRLPFSKKKFNTNPQSQANKNTFNILILIMSTDRVKNKIDAFEPQYLTQTTTHLINKIQMASTTSYPMFGFIETVICIINHKNESALSNEFQRMQRLLGKNSLVIPHIRKYNNDDKCKSFLDMQACLTDSLHFLLLANYVVIIEDDFLVTEHFLPSLHKHIYTQNTQSNNTADILQLYHQSSVLQNDKRVNFIIYTLYLLSMLPLIFLCFFLIFKRRKTRPLILLFFGSIIIFATLFRQLNYSKEITELAPGDPMAISTGAAVFLPVSVASNIIHANNKTFLNCSFVEDKSKIVANLLEQTKSKVFVVKSAAVQHIGMYSNIKGKIINPLLFEH